MPSIILEVLITLRDEIITMFDMDLICKWITPNYVSRFRIVTTKI